MSGDLSPHFSKREFACRCGCGFSDVAPALLYLLEAVREHFGAPVVINSGCRCAAHNVRVGGGPAGRHLAGDAADITVKGVAPPVVAAFCERLVRDRGGVGRYRSFTHVDTRGSLARWSG